MNKKDSILMALIKADVCPRSDFELTVKDIIQDAVYSKITGCPYKIKHDAAELVDHGIMTYLDILRCVWYYVYEKEIGNKWHFADGLSFLGEIDCEALEWFDIQIEKMLQEEQAKEEPIVEEPVIEPIVEQEPTIISVKEINKNAARGKLKNKDQIIAYCNKVGVPIPSSYWDDIEYMAETGLERGENNGNY